MPGPPCRKRFQFHLSTAIVLIFAAGGLMWANMRNHFGTEQWVTIGSDGVPRTITAGAWGWPLTVIGQRRGMWATVSFFGTAFNFVFALTVLFYFYHICEWLIRRRTTRFDKN